MGDGIPIDTPFDSFVKECSGALSHNGFNPADVTLWGSLLLLARSAKITRPLPELDHAGAIWGPAAHSRCSITQIGN